MKTRAPLVERLCAVSLFVLLLAALGGCGALDVQTAGTSATAASPGAPAMVPVAPAVVMDEDRSGAYATGGSLQGSGAEGALAP